MSFRNSGVVLRAVCVPSSSISERRGQASCSHATRGIRSAAGRARLRGLLSAGALTLTGRALSIDSGNQTAIYNSARAAARLNDRTSLLAALRALNKAAGLRKRIDEEPDFAAFRKDEEFARVVRELQ